MTLRCIDVHAHYLYPGDPPPGTPAQNFKVSPMPEWTPDRAIQFMNTHGVDVQMLSVPTELTPAQARRMNEYGAELVRSHPRRFGLLAALPLGDVEAAWAEIDHAFGALKADGVILLTNYQGHYLGDEKFRRIFAELNRRGAAAFVHPTTPAGYECVACGRPGPLIEFPFDTCRSVTDMLYAGVFRDFPDINFILSHAGGALPSLAPRIASIGTRDWVTRTADLTQQSILKYLRNLYFDTAIAGTAASIKPVLELTGPDHIVFGTDFPPASEEVIADNIAAFGALDCLSEPDKKQVYANGWKLFPNVAQRAGGEM